MKFLLIITFAFLISKGNAQNYISSDSIRSKESDCSKVLFDLIKTSDFKSDLMPKSYDSVDMTIDNKTDSVLSFHLSHDMFNGEGWVDAMIAAFDINFKNKQLLEVTYDPEKPKVLNYNKAIFEKIKPTCF